MDDTFLNEIKSIVKKFDSDILSYDESEFWMIQDIYEYLEDYAYNNQYKNMAIALKLARGLHDGVHRKLTIEKDGVAYRLPYLIHPLQVCRMLVYVDANLSDEMKDILFASALCHDMIEDVDFKDGGKELYNCFFLDKRIYETVKYLSKRKDFTEEEEFAFFHEIETHVLALLIKLSDRGNNVEDLYNMKLAKLHEYVDETDKFFIPMCDYALKHYPQLSAPFGILKDKIISLTEVAKILTIRYDLKEKELMNQLEELKKENSILRQSLNQGE